jgi:dTDP-4-amino-4,6-dideoxygalactose transaminase
LEDACQSIGATYRGEKAGTFGTVGCFSFYPGKNLGALGDGGALVTNDPKIAEHARKLRNHGGIQKYQHDHVGYNSRLDGLQAAFLAIKLKHIDAWNARRVANAKMYCKKLEGSKTVRPLLAGSNRQSNYHLFEVRVADGKRDALMTHLAKAGIASGIHYPDPLHLLPQVKKYGFKEGDFPVAEKLCQNLMSLPMFAELSPIQIDEVVYAIESF